MALVAFLKLGRDEFAVPPREQSLAELGIEFTPEPFIAENESRVEKRRMG